MQLQLLRASVDDAELLWKMQVISFADLYQTYQDHETSPANEPVENMVNRLKSPDTYYYLLQLGDDIVGAIRIVDKKETTSNKRISPIYILPQYRNRGIAQKAIMEAENLHGKEHWELETILQEAGNCYLYEKMGYHTTGKTTAINDKITLVFYEK